MNKQSRKFPAVMTTENILGIEAGTILVFDWASGKYVSVVEEEEITAEGEYYSGSAIALDPYLVKNNINNTFVVYIEKEEANAIEEELEFAKEESVADIKEVSTQKPKYNTLVVDCACGARRVLDVVDSPGLNFTLVAEDDASYIELHCKECDATLTLRFANDKPELETEDNNECTQKEGIEE